MGLGQPSSADRVVPRRRGRRSPRRSRGQHRLQVALDHAATRLRPTRPSVSSISTRRPPSSPALPDDVASAGARGTGWPVVVEHEGATTIVGNGGVAGALNGHWSSKWSGDDGRKPRSSIASGRHLRAGPRSPPKRNRRRGVRAPAARQASARSARLDRARRSRSRRSSPDPADRSRSWSSRCRSRDGGLQGPDSVAAGRRALAALTATRRSSSTATAASASTVVSGLADSVARPDGLGVAHGDRVAVLWPTTPEWCMAFWGTVEPRRHPRRPQRLVEERRDRLRPPGLRGQGAGRRPPALRAHRGRSTPASARPRADPPGRRRSRRPRPRRRDRARTASTS